MRDNKRLKTCRREQRKIKEAFKAGDTTILLLKKFRYPQGSMETIKCTRS